MRVIQLAVHGGAAGIDRNAFYLDASATGGDNVGSHAAQQQYNHQDSQYAAVCFFLIHFFVLLSLVSCFFDGYDSFCEKNAYFFALLS